MDDTDLNFCITKIYQPTKIVLTHPPVKDKDPKNKQYGAYTLYLNNQKVLFRIAKVTPNRPGAFVTTWQRSQKTNCIMPFDVDDGIDYLFVLVKGVSQENNKEYKGQFFFDKKVLIAQKIFSNHQVGGKLAMRVFPPWSSQLAQESIRLSVDQGKKIKKSQKMSETAIKTQIWQSNYFVSFHEKPPIDFTRISNLFHGQVPLDVLS